MCAGIVSLVTCLTEALPSYGQERKCEETALSLPKGFCATVFADQLGRARQLVVTPDNTVYVNTWSGVNNPYYNDDKPPEGGSLIALKDTHGTGHANLKVRFGPTFVEGARGGTGIRLYKDWLYVEINDKIVRYKIKGGQLEPAGAAETILSGIPITGEHPMHPFAIDEQGNLSVSIGSATNACQKKNRMPTSPGNDPCTELETQAGVWRYDASRTDQVFYRRNATPAEYGTAQGFDFDTSGRLYVTLVDAICCMRTGQNSTRQSKGSNSPQKG